MFKLFKKVLLGLLLVIFISSCSRSLSGGEGDEIDFCYKEISFANEMINKCLVDDVESEFSKNTNKVCFERYTYDSNIQDVHNECINNLRDLSCDRLKIFKTLDDLKEVSGCFEGIKKDPYKKYEACYRNYRSYCKHEIFVSCKQTELYSICEQAKDLIGDDTELNFDRNMIEDFCKEMENPNDLAQEADYFDNTCSNYQVDCNNIQEFDFRNDDWKTQCVE